MVTTRRIEILVGVFVAAGFAALFMLAMRVSNLSGFQETGGYTLTAYFENIGGLKVRAPVTVSGVRVGRVAQVAYDPERFQAKVTLNIAGEHDYFPEDTAASIYTAGLLGEQYIALEPGAETEVLKDKDLIRHTQSAVVFEEVISKVISNLTTN